MSKNSKDPSATPTLGINEPDYLGDAVRHRVRGAIQAIIEEELEAAFQRIANVAP